MTRSQNSLSKYYVNINVVSSDQSLLVVPRSRLYCRNRCRTRPLTAGVAGSAALPTSPPPSALDDTDGRDFRRRCATSPFLCVRTRCHRSRSSPSRSNGGCGVAVTAVVDEIATQNDDGYCTGDGPVR